MQIRSRMIMSADGYVTTPDGWPAQLADPVFNSGQSHGIREFLDGVEAALMGRTTFEPALGADRWRRPGGAARADPGRQPRRRRPSGRRSVHDRDPPRARSARQARTGGAAAAARIRPAADAGARHRYRADVRARARPPGRVGGDRLRRVVNRARASDRSFVLAIGGSSVRSLRPLAHWPIWRSVLGAFGS